MNYTLQSSQTLSYWIKNKMCKVLMLFPTKSLLTPFKLTLSQKEII